jgi:protein TonB
MNDQSIEAGDANLMPAFTLVLWMMCAAVGVTEMATAYPRPRRPTVPPAVNVVAAPVAVALAAAPAPQAMAPPLTDVLAPSADPSPPQPPQLAPAMAAQAPPDMLAVATAVAAPSFTVPLAPLVQKLPVTTTAPAARAPGPVALAMPAPQRLVFGQGEGAQPAPLYPSEARIAHQHGTVVVRFTVAPDGHVSSAEVLVPCSWPLLNQAAVRAVRDTWSFSAGPIRAYDVSFEYQLR